MTNPSQTVRARRELLDTHPAVAVAEAEYRRLLGYPRHHTPGERADELAAWARRWYAEHGRPWVYLREVDLQLADGRLSLEGADFPAAPLGEHLRHAGAVRAVVVAVSAGRACEEQAAQLWREAKPDEYFFLEMFGSAVVEHLVAGLNGRLCERAEQEGLMAVAPYSPGYTGWDVADQPRLFELIARGMTSPWPEPFTVLTSGMLRPKKSLLSVVGLAVRHHGAPARPRLVPCQSCAFAPCQYRRAPYLHAPAAADSVASLQPPAPAEAPAGALKSGDRYTVNLRALQKWARERVWIEPRADGTVGARFRFDGTTCSNLGRPLAFDYEVALGAPGGGYTILEARCRPAPGDEGHTQMCAYLSDRDALLAAIAGEPPLLGRPLDDVLAWTRPSAPSGCHCSADSRTHKWGLALEAIHFTLARHAAGTPVFPSTSS